MSIPKAISDLKAAPEAFLRASRLKIFGGGQNSFDGPANFRMEVNPEGGYKAIYVTQDAAPLGVDQFQAWYIPMQQLRGFTVNSLPKPEDTPLRLLLTSQITGCLFGVGANAQGTCVAHIQPDQASHMDKSGVKRREARQEDLWRSAATAGLAPIVYGGMSYSLETECVTVVGQMDDSGQWKFFSQSFDGIAKKITGITSF